MQRKPKKSSTSDCAGSRPIILAKAVCAAKHQHTWRAAQGIAPLLKRSESLYTDRGESPNTVYLQYQRNEQN